MRIASPPLLMMATRTDKEARLKDFIAEGLAHRPEGQPAPSRSRLSYAIPTAPLPAPSVRRFRNAIWASASELYSARRTSTIRWPCRCSTSAAANSAFSAIRASARPTSSSSSARHVWTGDCLRRDPNKRDAFEVYHSGDATIRLYAAVSFEKLWAAARPIKPVRSGAVAPEIIAAGQTDESERDAPQPPPLTDRSAARDRATLRMRAGRMRPRALPHLFSPRKLSPRSVRVVGFAVVPQPLRKRAQERASTGNSEFTAALRPLAPVGLPNRSTPAQ